MVQVGCGIGEGSICLRCRGKKGAGECCEREFSIRTATAPVDAAECDMEPKVGGCKVQSGCAGCRLTRTFEGSAIRVSGMLLEVQVGCSAQSGLGEVQELQVQVAGHDHPIVLVEVYEALELLTDQYMPCNTWPGYAIRLSIDRPLL
jgi:hypothetical protein